MSYAPASLDRQLELLQNQQSSRESRARTEGRDYLFVLDEDSIQPFFWCWNPKSGETYEVTAFDCNCGDFIYRGRRVACKHMLALKQALMRDETRTW